MSLGGDGSTYAAYSQSCAYIKSYFGKSTDGFYYVNVTTIPAVSYVYCQLSTSPANMFLNGTSTALAATSCAAINMYYGLTTSGLYYINTPQQVYCDFTVSPVGQYTPGSSAVSTNPQSCRLLKIYFPSLATSVYWLYASGSSVQAYCDMSSGTGWTMIMKLGANQFCYGSAQWTNNQPYNPSK